MAQSGTIELCHRWQTLEVQTLEVQTLAIPLLAILMLERH